MACACGVSTTLNLEKQRARDSSLVELQFSFLLLCHPYPASSVDSFLDFFLPWLFLFSLLGSKDLVPSWLSFLKSPTTFARLSLIHRHSHTRIIERHAHHTVDICGINNHDICSIPIVKNAGASIVRSQRGEVVHCYLQPVRLSSDSRKIHSLLMSRTAGVFCERCQW